MSKNKQKQETPEERRLRYKKGMKEKRMQMQEAKKTGALEKRILSFLRQIMLELKLTQKHLGIALCMSQQAINDKFIRDDIRYSQVQRALEYYGYHFEASLAERSPANTREKRYDYDIVGCVSNCRRSIELPKYLIENIQKDGRMAFLGRVIEESGRSLGSICRQAGVELSSFRYFILEDDMKVSYLYKIADALSLKVVWHVDPKKLCD